MAAEPLVVYTDGACSGNPGPGGWAWAVPDGAYASGPAAQTTNQRMEIEAALEAVRTLGDPDRPLEVVSDSTYVVRCFTDGWWQGWLRKGWVNSQRKPVANRDLWEPLIDRVRELGNVSFRWVKGHSGDAMNDLVDQLAVDAARTQQGTSGTITAAVVEHEAEAALEAGPLDAEGVHVDLHGFVVVVAGLRPSALGPDEHGALFESVRSAFAAVLAELATRHGDVVVVSGLRLGSELAGAEAALELGLPLAVVLPYPEPHVDWATLEQARFDAALRRAEAVLTLEAERPHTKAQATALLARRDAFFVRRADAAVIVWDGHDTRTARLLEDLRDRLGREAVIVVDPATLLGGAG